MHERAPTWQRSRAAGTHAISQPVAPAVNAGQAGRLGRAELHWRSGPAIQVNRPSGTQRRTGEGDCARVIRPPAVVICTGRTQTAAVPWVPGPHSSMPPVPWACLPGCRGRHGQALSSARVRIGGDEQLPPSPVPTHVLGAAAYLFQIRDLLAALAALALSRPRYLSPSRSTTCFSPPQSPSGP